MVSPVITGSFKLSSFPAVLYRASASPAGGAATGELRITIVNEGNYYFYSGIKAPDFIYSIVSIAFRRPSTVPAGTVQWFSLPHYIIILIQLIGIKLK